MISLGLMFLLFLISIVLCGVAGAIVKRYEVQAPRLGLVIFHVIYITGLVAAYILL